MKKLVQMLVSMNKIGMIGFGGGNALIPVIQQEVVEEKGFITGEEYEKDIVAAALTPGALPVEIAVGVGKAVSGKKGMILAAIAGFINSAQVNQADWSYGKEWPTDCLSMAIIGGTSMAGGSGTIYGTVVGVVLISVLINGMTILNWNIYLQYIVRGAILIGSLVLMAYRDKYRD